MHRQLQYQWKCLSKPRVTTSRQPQQIPNFCALCTPIGKQCLNNYLLPIHPEWSDPEEEEKDIGRQDREEKGIKEIED